MNVRKIATIIGLVLSSFAASNVAPTKAELEAMYDKAFREFNANNYTQALKELDSIDARQPDLAESHNLRGVILMRQAQYDQAEVSLQKALAADPKFWNARFNLAAIPFLRKDWTEARKRFDALLQGDSGDLQGDAAQLIQYKILLTYLLQGNENMVDAILTKLELSPETPAANYSRAAMALQEKKQKEAADLLATAERNFSPQLNKLFAESLYEVGWLQKPAGQTRAALELTSAAERVAKTKAVAAEKYERAEQAFQQYDLPAALKLVDEADAADPNQAATLNLRGEILLAQKDFEGAETAFKRAQKLNPKLTEAHYNLAQIPFKKKEYAKARERFEALFTATPAGGGDKNQTAQIIRFKIYLTLLLEGKDSRAQKVMEQFKFTGDTPALYHAQAAWEFKHGNTAKAHLWIVSARKIYSPALNLVFAESFYDLGWVQRQPATATTDTTEVAKTETPPIEPSPITASSLATDPAAKAAEDASSVKEAATTAQTTVKDSVPTASTPEAVIAKNEKNAVAAASPKVEIPVTPNPASAANPQTTNLAQAPTTNQGSTAPKVVPPAPAIKKNLHPATALAPTVVKPRSRPSFVEWVDRKTNPHTFGILALVSAGVLMVAWVVFSELRRRLQGSVSVYQSPAPAAGPAFGLVEQEITAGQLSAPLRLAGGPPQVSLQLKASEPSVRRAAVPFGKGNRPFGAGPVSAAAGNGLAAERHSRETVGTHEPGVLDSPLPESFAEGIVGNVQDVPNLAPASLSAAPDLPSAQEWEFNPAKTDSTPSDEATSSSVPELSMLAEFPPTIPPPASFESVPAFEKPVESKQPSPTDFAGSKPFESKESTPIEAEDVAPVDLEETTLVESKEQKPVDLEETALVERKEQEPVDVEETALVQSKEQEPVDLEETTLVEPKEQEPVDLEETALVESKEQEPVDLDEAAPVESKEREPVDFDEAALVESKEQEPVDLDEAALVESKEREPVDLDEAAPFESKDLSPVEIEESEVGEIEEPEPVESEATLRVDGEEPPPVEADDEPAAIEDKFPAIDFDDSPASGLDEPMRIELEEVGLGETVDERLTDEEPAFSETVEDPIPILSEMAAKTPAPSFSESISEKEPVAQGQPIPYQIPSFLTDATVAEAKTEPESSSPDLPAREISGIGLFRPPVEPPSSAPQIISTEPLSQQPTTPAIMPQTIQPTPVPIRTAPMTGATPQPASAMQTAVQLTFSFEIASLQLTPSFKMGALQLKPTSKVVTMRLAPSQQPQPAMNLQVTFEISSIQLTGNSIGIIRLTPSQQQRPGVSNTPAFNIAGLQLLSGADSAVQLTPSQQGQASVHVTGRFQIATVEFSPSFEIASILLNSTSRNVSVQLPGAGPSAVEGAPVFEIINVQLAANGEIGMMQLNSQGAPPKPA